MSNKLWSSMLLASALSVTFAVQVRADADARATSRALFQDAEKLAASGDRAAACRKYADSYSLDPGLDALLRWADCLELEGKLASAYAAFQDAVELGQRSGDARRSLAESRAKLLRPRLSYLTIEVPRERALPTLFVERDGFRVGSSAWGVPTPIDPGRHTIRASAYGYREWQTSVEISADGAGPHVEIPMLERVPESLPRAEHAAPNVPPQPAPTPPTAASAVVLRAPASPAERPPATDSTSQAKLGSTRIAALAFAGASLVGVGAGVYFLAQTRSTLQERDAICPSGKDCEPGTNQRLAELTAEAVASQRTEIICFAMSGAALGIGLGLWLVPQGNRGAAPRAALLAPVVHRGGAGLLLQGEL